MYYLCLILNQIKMKNQFTWNDELVHAFTQVYCGNFRHELVIGIYHKEDYENLKHYQDKKEKFISDTEKYIAYKRVILANIYNSIKHDEAATESFLNRLTELMKSN